MNIKSEHTSIRVSEKFLEPTLEIFLSIELINDHQLPLNITGFLKVENKIVCPLEWFHENNYLLKLWINHNPNDHTVKFQPYTFKFYCTLSKEAIDFIEDTRNKSSKKEVRFWVDLNVTSWDTYIGNGNKYFEMHYLTTDHIIEQSHWVREFAPKLGIGEFLILELKVPENIPSEYSDLARQLVDIASELKEEITEGSFKKVLKNCFQIFELIMPNKNNEAKSMFEKLFEAENWNSEYKTKWEGMIKALHEFYSKPKHPTSFSKELNPKIEFKKEDAYYAYALCIGMINLLFKKMERL